MADEGFGIPQEIRENFDLLHKNKILNNEQLNQLRKMVGFRNIAVHEYQEIHIGILKSILVNHLAELEEFYVSVLKFYKLAGKTDR